MIKKFLAAILIALPLSISAQTVKIGVIDVEALVQAAPETAEASKTLQEAQTKYTADLKKLEEEVQKKVDELETLRKDTATPATILERRQQEVQALYERYSQTAQTYEQDLKQQQYQLMAPIYDKIQKAAQSVGQENGFTLVIPVGAIIYMSSDVIDINPLVKAKIEAPAAQ